MAKSYLIAAYIFVIGSFTALFARYGYLQLIDHGALLQQSINNYSSIVASLPVRGGVLDKNGIILADNKASYVVAVLPKNLKKDHVALFTHLSQYINLTELDKRKFFAQLKNAKNYDWIVLKDDLSNTEIAKLTAHNYEFPEIAVFARTKRYYPFDEVYSHSIGYVARVSANDKQKLNKAGQSQDYLANDYIGKSGLEQFYENLLRGNIGKKIIQTDAIGNEVGLIANSQARDGYTLQLTLDNALEKDAWNLLGNRRGAIVAIDPQTGGILAFVSKPGFDPNWFIDGISLDDWSDLSTDPDKPLLNRAAQGTYPPGSTFKPFVALTALYLRVITPNTTVNDPGYFIIPGSTHKFRDSYPYGRGTLNLLQAIIHSSDTYFYKLGLDMGIDRLDKGLSLFGFGMKTGIDLPHENTGLLPSRAWKAKRFAKNPHQKNWLAADSVTMAIGQGFNNYTPLQMAYAVSIIANNGVALKPHFLDKVIDKNGSIVKTYPTESHTLPIPNSQIQFIKHAMQQVVVQGTAAGINSGLKYTMAGKTGTAQVVALNQNNRQNKFAGAAYKDHSWFIAFAPVDKPKIAVAIIVENGGWGASVAAPIARALFDNYLLAPRFGTGNDQYKKFVPAPDNETTDSDNDNEDDSDDTDTN